LASPSVELTIGIDIGTTSVKGVVVDADGDIVARTRIPHSVIVSSPGQIEHDPRIAWRRSPRRVLASLGDRQVRGIGICGMGPSLAAVNRSGVPQSPGLIYGDVRGGGPTGPGEAVGFLRTLVGQHPRAVGFWPAQTAAIASLGGPPVMGELMANMWAPLWDGVGWDATLLRECGARLDQMPTVLSDGARAGWLGDTAIECGSLDVTCETLAAGTPEPDEALVLCGSTLLMMIPVAHEREVPGVWVYPTGTGRMATGASNAGGLFLDWVDRVIAPGGGSVLPERVPVWCPYIRGERTPWHDAQKTASLVGLNIAHDAAALRRAAYEASGFVVRHHLDLCGMTPRRIVAVGGGTAVPEWIQALADCTGVPVETRGTGAGAAVGAAFMARIAAGLEGSTADASRWVRGGPTVEPDAQWIGPVRGRYERFLELASLGGAAKEGTTGLL
jgi:xylulokinase